MVRQTPKRVHSTELRATVPRREPARRSAPELSVQGIQDPGVEAGEGNVGVYFHFF